MSNRMTTLLWFLLGITVTLAVVLGVVVLSGDDDDGGTAATTTTVAAETTAPTITAVETTVTTAVGTTVTTAPAHACTGMLSATMAAVPGPGVSIALGDFDADGLTDQFMGYQKGDGTFWIQIVLAYGWATEIEAGTRADVYGAQPFSFTDDPDPWIGIAAVDSGASTEILQFFQLDGCTIVRSTVDGSFEASFLHGAGVMHMDGLACGAEGLTSRSATTGDGTTWEFSTTDYQWDPVARTFLDLGMASSTLTSPADDAVIFSAAEFNCPFAP